MQKIYRFLIKEWFLLTFTVALVALFFYNKNMYDNRFNGYLYTDAVNYNELYFSDETFRIKGLKVKDGDSLSLVIAPQPAQNKWTVQNPDATYNLNGVGIPTLKLKSGIHTYTVSSDHSDPTLKSNHFTIEYNAQDKSMFIVNSTLPLIEHGLFPISRWTNFSNTITEAEIHEAKKIITEKTKLADSLPTVEKIKRISQFLVTEFVNAEGAPSGDMKQQTPLSQFKLACSNQNKVDCAIYSDVFHLFANCAGIPTRKIGVAGWMDYIVTSGHVFNECYIKEQGKWAFVDLTSKKALVLNERNEVLNSVDLLNAVNAKSFEGKKALRIHTNSLVDTVNYNTVNQSEIDYLKPTVQLYVIKENINENMSFSETFKEYLGEASHYGTYYSNTIKVDNSKHYYKLFVYKLSIALLGIWFLCLVIRFVLFFYNRSQKN
jgi:hypothetical protein